jgi:hypothetical protein
MTLDSKNICHFGTISEIKPDAEDTWSNKSFITFDTDWANDDVLLDTMELVENYRCGATWFITHETKAVEKLRNNRQFELGIHPNFNCLLEHKKDFGRNAADVLQRLHSIVPEATTVRSHSMMQSSRLLNMFRENGFTHDANHFIPHHAGINVKPWVLWNGLYRVPYIWEDDLHHLFECGGITQQSPRDIVLTGQGLKVFDFHPIHVFLNTESVDRYKRTRALHQKPQELVKHRFKGYGTRNRLVELLRLNKQS